MKHYFFATLTAIIELSDEEFELLFNEAERHYDFTVRSSTQIGGLLFGIKNRRSIAKEFGEVDNEVSFSEREIGLMLKALEMTMIPAGPKLYRRLIEIAKELQQKTVEVNKPLNDVKVVGQFIGD